MYKAIFALVPSYSNDDWLDKKLMGVTNAYIRVTNKNRYPIIEINDYCQCNELLNSAEFLIVVTAGNFIIDPDHIWNKINDMPDSVGLIGNLLQYENDVTPYLHEQFFIIRTKVFSKLNFSLGRELGPHLLRSQKSMHNNHAPLEITLSNSMIENDYKFGSKIIEDCLKEKYRVVNYDEDWRYSLHPNIAIAKVLEKYGFPIGATPTRGYCYPKKSTETFSKSLKQLQKMEGLDEAQEIFIDLANEYLNFEIVNAWHFEKHFKCDDVDTIICPAVGFLGEMIALKSSAKSIILYDINKNNIDFKKHLYKNWNGKNYDQFVKLWADQRNLTVEPFMGYDKQFASDDERETIDLLFPVWKEWINTVDTKFICIDLVKDIDIFLSFIKPKSLICTSSILTIYPQTFIKYDQEQIIEVRKKIQSYISKNSCQWREIS